MNDNSGNRVLIIVHPGSACGSADFNLGIEAAALRDAMAEEVARWDGDIHIIDGELSDELHHYARLGLAIECAIERALTTDRKVKRTMACALNDPNWTKKVSADFACLWPGTRNNVLLTGAWHHADGSGCINAIHNVIGPQERIAISERAMRLP